MSKIITLTINKPKLIVNINPALEGAREIQVLHSHYVKRKILRLVELQKVYKLNGDEEVEILSIDPGYYTIADLQRSFRIVNKGVDIVKCDGDCFIKCDADTKLTEELYTKLGVLEILTAGKFYLLTCKNTPSLSVYCDIVDSHYSYENAFTDLCTPSHLLAVVPSQNYPACAVKQIHSSYLNRLELNITNVDGSIPTFGMNEFVITLKLS